MTTPKRKPKSSNGIDQFFDILLFVKRYRYETSLPVPVATKRLNNLSLELRGWLIRKPHYQITSEYNYDHQKLDIRSKDSHYTVVHSIMTLTEQDDTTIVEGEIRIGVAYLFLMILSIIWLLLIFQLVAGFLPDWVIWLSMVVPFYNFVHVFYEHRRLFNNIKNAITPRFSDRAFEKAKSYQRLETDTTDAQLDYHNQSGKSRYDHQ